MSDISTLPSYIRPHSHLSHLRLKVQSDAVELELYRGTHVTAELQVQTATASTLTTASRKVKTELLSISRCL